MRFETAASSKGVKQGIANLHAVPAEGTKLRALYDLFVSHKGSAFKFVTDGATGRRIEDLRNYYGCDIRNLGYRQWILAGEWFGREYVDYVAERFHAEEREQRRHQQ